MSDREQMSTRETEKCNQPEGEGEGEWEIGNHPLSARAGDTMWYYGVTPTALGA